ncbi:MAG: hypothetical protein II502_01425 [Paludibacteraceae bacterium]|nr:hypothetical protein [Paludibacteraceae bacterium]
MGQIFVVFEKKRVFLVKKCNFAVGIQLGGGGFLFLRLSLATFINKRKITIKAQENGTKLRRRNLEASGRV